MEKLHLLGLDFGSTTSSALVASAQVLRNSITGRMELCQPSILYRSQLAFTPFSGDRIDERELLKLLDHWIQESSVDPKTLVAGGAIITGLAAQESNVAVIESLVRQRVNDVIFATADDPRLESWLAFMGSCLELSRSAPETYFLNLDIGGGTTNLASGLNGEIVSTGCLFAGARHFQFVPGTYQIKALSSYAVRLFADLQIARTIGDSLSPVELRAILDFYVGLIEAAVIGDHAVLNQVPAKYHIQVPFVPPPGVAPVITLSGGVGELVYQRARGRPLPATTAFGDLGIDLAQRLAESPLLARHLQTHVPTNSGHATVYGICLFGTEISGTTLYMSAPNLLPLRDLPILSRIRAELPDDDFSRAVDLVKRSTSGGCLEIDLRAADYRSVKELGGKLAAALRDCGLTADRVLVLFVSQNVGKTLGSYVSDWGRLPIKLIVIDEIITRHARFASLGALRDNIVPVSFYGVQ